MILPNNAFAFCGFFVSVIQTVGSLSLTIQPEHVHAQPDGSATIAVQCATSSGGPLAACQFRVWRVETASEGATLPVAQNRVDRLPVDALGANVSVELRGVNFHRGRCEIVLRGAVGEDLLVGCQLTTRTHLSATRTMSIFCHQGAELPLEENNRQLEVRPDGKASFMLRTVHATPLQRCATTMLNTDRVTVLAGGEGGDGDNVVRSVHDEDRYAALGFDRLVRGECGFTINHVSAADAGVFFLRAVATDAEIVGAFAVTVVVRAAFSLAVTLDKVEYSMGDNLTATCTVHGVPQGLASSHWKFDGRPLDNAGADDWFEEGWSWPWQGATLSQSVTVALREAGPNKCIQCSMRGMAKKACVQWRDATTAVTSPPFGDDSSGTAVSVFNPATSPATEETSKTPAVAGSKIHGFFSSLLSGNHTEAVVICNFILLVVFVVVVAMVTGFAKLTDRWCFRTAQSEHRVSSETIYEQIQMGYTPSTEPPCVPPLPASWNESSVPPLQLAPPAPSNSVDNPEYMIIHEESEDSSRAGGYMEPRYRNMK